MEASPIDDCVFCTRRNQPEILFETQSLYVMPDKYPMRPGHFLIIAREHLKCYAMASDELLAELDETAERVRRFLDEAYGAPVLTFENGVAGQSVFHAHLHLVPGLIKDVPAWVLEHRDVIPVEGWQQVRNYFAGHGQYRYMEFAGRRFVIDGHSPLPQMMRRAIAEATGMEWGKQGWVKTTTDEDVREVNRRWGSWVLDSPGRRH